MDTEPEGSKSQSDKAEGQVPSEAESAEGDETLAWQTDQAKKKEVLATEFADKLNDSLGVIGKGFQGLIAEQRKVAEELRPLQDIVRQTHAQCSEIRAHSDHFANETLARARDEASSAVNDVFSKIVYPFYDQVFRKVCAIEAGNMEPDAFLLNLLDNIGGYVNDLDIKVIRPQPGEPFDLKYMEAAGAAPCGFWRKPDTVSKVHHCGFAKHDEGSGEHSVLRKARVDVYRST